MRDEVIAIGAYCPDQPRKEVLRKLLDHLKQIKPQADLLVYSRSTLNPSIEKLVDHIVINKHNLLLEDYDLKSVLTFTIDDNVKVGSSFANPKANTHLPSLFNFLDSWKYCKQLGYKKLIYLEYDVIIHNSLEFENLSSLLDTDQYDIINYIDPIKENYTFPIFAVNLLSDNFSTTVEKEIVKLRKGVSKGHQSEKLFYNDLKSFYGDRYLFVINQNYFECAVDSTPLVENLWGFFVIEHDDDPQIDNRLLITIMNPSINNLKENILFKVNNELIFEFNEEVGSKQWSSYSTPFTLDQIDSIEIITPNKSFALDLSSLEEKRKFKQYNYYYTIK